MKRNKLLIGFFLSLIVLILVEFFIYLNYSNFTRKITNIAFVVSGDNLDYYSNLMSGAETAAMDNDCVVNFLNVSTDAGVEGEYDLIKRQLKEGVDYVVSVSNHQQEINDYIYENAMTSKVIAIDYVDDYSMGQALAETIIGDESEKPLVVSNQENPGLMETLNDAGYSYDFCDLASFDFDDVKVHADSKIYCIDNSSQSVYYLDKGRIDTLAFRDDYSIGYITVKHLLTGDSLSKISEGIPLYYIVDRDSMYSEKMEKILFPFAR